MKLTALLMASAIALALPTAASAKHDKPSDKTSHSKHSSKTSTSSKSASKSNSKASKSSKSGKSSKSSAQASAIAPSSKATPRFVAKPLSSADVLAAAKPSDWREVASESAILMEFKAGEGQAPAQVLIELAPDFAPKHSANIRQLARAGYFDGLAVIRVQDNYVTQWGDPSEDDAKAKAKPADLPKPPAEFDRPLKGLAFNALMDTDLWAPQVGFVQGWPVAVDPKQGRAWLAHCNSMVGAARGNEADSSDGAGLYTVIGQAPRALDLNITVVGRVLQGQELLSALPRGTGVLGFYEHPEQMKPIQRVRVLADVPEQERPHLQVLRTDTGTWEAWLHSRRNRSGWFIHNPGRVELCGVLPPTRTAP